MTARILRGVGIAIAIAALIDPPLTVTARGRPRLALVLQDPVVDAARRANERLSADLGRDFAIVSGRDEEADAVVVTGSRYPDRPFPERQRVFTVTTAPAANEPDVRISAVSAPRTAPPGTLIRVEVDVDAFNVPGSTSMLVVRSGRAGVEVGRATHAWAATERRWRAALEVTPLDMPPWRLHVELSSVPGEHAVADNTADVMVDAAEPLRVLVYEPRPSWAGTFARRAIESDRRFEVGSVSYPSRGIRITTDATPSLQSVSLDRVRTIIVGGLDRLTADDARALERFMREREGAVVLLPDSRSDARTVRQWLSIPAETEVLLEKAARLAVEPPLPPISASELLTFGASPGTQVITRESGHRPVVTVTPYGGGRLVLSGALDAWRYRAEDNAAFDRFWQALIAGIAMAAPPAIDIEVEPAVIAPGDRAEVRVRVRRTAAGIGPADTMRISSTLSTGEAVRLWPDAAPDTFRGSFGAPRVADVNRITVAVDGAKQGSAIASFIVAPDAHVPRPSGPPLSLLAESHGGIDVTPDTLSDLERRLRRDVSAPPAPVERRPMRSAWWIIPFAGCLSAEWWLRRRRGLK